MALGLCSFLHFNLLQIFLFSLWDHHRYHLCSGTLPSVPAECGFTFFWTLWFMVHIFLLILILFLIFFYFSSTPSCHFPAFKNSYGVSNSWTNIKIDMIFSPVGKTCLKTELQFSDYYCLLAVHVLIDVWRETGK